MAIINVFGSKSGKLKIDKLKVDISQSESHERNNLVTKNPVESGADVTDHIQIQPAKLTISGVVSATPVQVLGFQNSNSRVSDAYSALKKISTKKELVDIVTGIEVYQNMALVTLTVPRDRETGKSFRFTAQFEEVFIVDSQVVSVGASPMSGNKQAETTKSSGKQTPTKPDAAAESKGSILFDIFKPGVP
jgi:hypothetical protein